MDMTPRDFSIVNALLNGRNKREVASDHGISTQQLNHILRDQVVRDKIAERMEKLGEKVISFKLDAVDGAIDALAEVRRISTQGATDELKRLASMDLIKVSGLMPRKRVLVEGSSFNGIDDDLKDYIHEVMKEASNIVDAQP